MIRMAKEDELKVIVKMKLKMFKEAGVDDHLPSNAYDDILESYQELYKQDKMRHFCFQDQGEIVACAGGFIKEDIPFSFFNPPYYGFIGDVYTVVKYRGNGYATRLTNQVIQWLKEKNVEVIRLLASKAGEGIYKKLGFKVSDEMVLEL